uniref:Erythrocyte membrane protein band 4.1 like 3 n=1 Tax=Anas platyrhynchos TaxID=8839 RepID=A0A8B9TPA3_ANAPL
MGPLIQNPRLTHLKFWCTESRVHNALCCMISLSNLIFFSFQATDKEQEFAAASAKQLEYQQLEDDKLSQKSSSSKLSKSPLKIVKKPKNMQCKVTLLDGSEYACEVEKRSRGQVLFDKVCEHLNLLEKDYFGLTYRDTENQKNWLDPAKEIKKQIRSGAWQFAFNVKFYPPDPAQLSEDITRYYLCLQLRDDIVSGRLPCSFVTLALLGSYTYGSDYVSEFRFAPNHTKELEDKVIELHKSHRGMTPAEAEMHFLENAKKLSMYGVDLHHAKDSEGVEIMLGVCASGLLIYRDRLRINRFAWPKVLKISYKRNNFYIKIRPGEFEQFESTIGFKLPNHRAAKRLWKVCVEHHTFFRLLLPEAPPKKFLTLGSKFRYSGRTQAQTRRASALIDRPAPYFERSSSKRYTMSRSLDGGPDVTEVLMLEVFISLSMLLSVLCEEMCRNSILYPFNTVSLTFPFLFHFFQNSLIKRIQGENVYVKHSNLMLEDLDKTQEDLMKHQTNISELKRTFLETSTETAVSNEWEKRLSTSPVRLAARQEEAPMIEPLVPEEVNKIPSEVVDDESKKNVTYKVVTVSSKAGIPPELLKSSTILMQSFEDLESEIQSKEENKQKMFTLGKSYDTMSGRIVTMTSKAKEGEKTVQPSVEVLQKMEREVQESVKIVPAVAEYGIVEHATDEKARRGSDVQSTKRKLSDSLTPIKEAESQLQKYILSNPEALLNVPMPFFFLFTQSPVVKTETISFSSVPAGGESLEISTKEVPVVHTETKTITYESSQVDCGADSEPGVLMSAQTITSETTSTTTTTHITKTVKGGISETRIEKRIVITGDADIDHDQALAQAIKEAKEQHPDMSVTKVVVHKETEITPEDGED